MALEFQPTSVIPSPYKGLLPYSEEDSAFFFGRDRFSRIISCNLAVSRLTILYGPSGVGKSSLLRSGVATKIYQEAKENLKKFGVLETAVVIFHHWQNESLLTSLKQQIETDIRKIGLNIQSPEPSLSFVDTLKFWTDHLGGEEESGKLLIILDQFEEYFLHHSLETGAGTFSVEFPLAVNSDDLPTNFLISIREDALAKLFSFRGAIPQIFDNCLRIKYLDRESARVAIKGPIETYNRFHPMPEQQFDIEDALIDNVLSQIIHLSEFGSGEVGGIKDLPEVEIDPSYLQLIMARLWQEEVAKGSHCLRQKTLYELGGVEQLISWNVDEQMQSLSPQEQKISSQIFQYLITPFGQRLAYSSTDLADATGINENQLTDLLQKFSSGEYRILRPVAPSPGQPHEYTRYEVFHDVLARAILNWRKYYLQNQQK